MASPVHVLNTERDTRRFRLLALMLVTATVYLRQDELDLGPALGWSFFFFAYTLTLGFTFSKIISRWSSRDSLVYVVCALIILEALVVASLIHFAGGIASITIILIPLFIIYHTIYLGRFGGLLSATLFAFMYVGLAFLEEETEGRELFLVSQVVLFYFLAEFSTYLANRIIVEQGEKELLQQFIVDTGQTQGIRLYSFDVAAGTATFDGLAVDETALERFVESLRRMRGLSSIRLSRVSGDQGSGGESRRITFTVAARFK